MKIKFSKEREEILNMVSTIVITASGDKYYHMPYWYKKTKEEGIYEELNYDHLPQDLKDAIILQKEYVTIVPPKLIMILPKKDCYEK